MGDLSPGKALPNSEADCNGWIEVATGCRGTGDDSKSNTDSKAPADLKDVAEGCRIGLLSIDVEGSDGCYARETEPLSVASLCIDTRNSLTHRRRLR